MVEIEEKGDVVIVVVGEDELLLLWLLLFGEESLLLMSLLLLYRWGDSDERPAVNRWIVSSICCSNSLGSSP